MKDRNSMSKDPGVVGMGRTHVMAILLLLPVIAFAQIEDPDDTELKGSMDRMGLWLENRYYPNENPSMAAPVGYALVRIDTSPQDEFLRNLVMMVKTQVYTKTVDVGWAALAARYMDREGRDRTRLALFVTAILDAQAKDGGFASECVVPPPPAKPYPPKDPRRPSPIKLTPSKGRKREEKGSFLATCQALLGLRAAAHMEITVPPETWKDTVRYLEASQNADGGWDFGLGPDDEPSCGSATAMGAAGLTIARYFAGIKVPKDDRMVRAIDWLAKHWTTKEDPGYVGQDLPPDQRQGANAAGRRMLFLYSCEIFGSLAQVQKFGEHDWYAEGMKEILAAQDTSGSIDKSVPETTWACLFLRKGTQDVGAYLGR